MTVELVLQCTLPRAINGRIEPVNIVILYARRCRIGSSGRE